MILMISGASEEGISKMNFMEKNKLHFFMVICCLTISFAVSTLFAMEMQMETPPPRLIAHAGGDYKGVPKTNSLQALKCSVREGFRYIEIDLSKTADGVIMLAHDWDYAKTMVKGTLNSKLPAYKEIKKAKKSHTLLNLKSFTKWLRKHEDVRIITDVKDDNIEVLKFIKKKYPGMLHHFIPQIYSFAEYTLVKNMGYKDIILTLYRIKESDDDIIAFCQKNPLFALTISTQRAATEFLEKCSGLSIPIYVHTVNDITEYQMLRGKGVHGVYTDFFQPDSWFED